MLTDRPWAVSWTVTSPNTTRIGGLHMICTFRTDELGQARSSVQRQPQLLLRHAHRVPRHIRRLAAHRDSIAAVRHSA
jgi:hypothetical protein